MYLHFVSLLIIQYQQEHMNCITGFYTRSSMCSPPPPVPKIKAPTKTTGTYGRIRAAIYILHKKCFTETLIKVQKSSTQSTNHLND